MNGQPSPWAQAFRGFDDWDDEKKQPLVMQFLQAAGQMMQSAQVVPKPNDDEIQLRGVYGNYPTRVTVDAFWDIAIDVKAPNQQQSSISIRFDPESAPSPGDVDPWDDDDDVRVFLARCVYVEDSASEIAETLRRVQQLPAEFRQHLFGLMQSNHLSSFNLTGDGPGTSFRNNMGEMWDPMTQLSQALWLVAYGANVYGALPPETQAHSAQPAYPGQALPGGQMVGTTQAKCRYCSTLFLLGPDAMCPNCGGAYAG